MRVGTVGLKDLCMRFCCAASALPSSCGLSCLDRASSGEAVRLPELPEEEDSMLEVAAAIRGDGDGCKGTYEGSIDATAVGTLGLAGARP